MLNHVIESQQFTPEILLELFKRADELRVKTDLCLIGKILATLFYEPSTRTRLSFDSAMHKLGGRVISTENAKEFSSAIKGESLVDTIRIVSSYCDCIVLRHYDTGAALEASKVSKVPIINAGDGKGQHPTQALLDVYTIYREFERLENLKIAMVGDLASGRTVRSLCYLLGKFPGNKIIFVSPENLEMSDDIKEYLKKKNVEFVEETVLDKVLPDINIVYMTRIQKERISLQDYKKAKGKYVINQLNFQLIKKNSRIMHPLPHVEEIDLPIDVEQIDKRVAYFRQAENGLYIRMALLDLILNKENCFEESY
ncbi:MAG: aspartate carbamoyltransferase [Nanoarchaeota archaeon]|nr:aspartate carbamoyltransferase [Nanoarchaeota archaeon]